jgi:hypothetical protein
MTEQEYLDPKRFPLTTQPGLTLQQQRLLDAVNCDDLEQMLAEGKTTQPATAASPGGIAGKGQVQEAAGTIGAVTAGATHHERRIASGTRNRDHRVISPTRCRGAG